MAEPREFLPLDIAILTDDYIIVDHDAAIMPNIEPRPDACVVRY